MSIFDQFRNALVGPVILDPPTAPPTSSPIQPTTQARFDSWVNPVTGLGVPGIDPTTATFFYTLSSLSWREKTDLWRHNGIAKRIVEEKAKDAVRNWVTYSIDSEDAEESAEFNDQVQEDLKRLDARQALQQCLFWARLYGTGLILVHFEGEEDTSEPLPEDGPLRPIAYLEVQPAGWGSFTWPIHEDLDIRSRENIIGYRYQPVTGPGEDWHKSRVIRIDHTILGDREALAIEFWGEGCLEPVYTALKGEGSAYDSSVQYLKDSQYTVWKVKALINKLFSRGKDNFLARYTEMLNMRSKTKSIVIDQEHEEVEDRTIQMSGVPDLLELFPYRVSAASGYPMIKLYGRSPGGLGDDGKGEIRMYYDDVKAQTQETRLRPALEYLTDLVLRQIDGPTSGTVPDSWQLAFNPLYEPTALEESQRRKTNADADVAYVRAGVLSTSEVALSRFGGTTYGEEIYLDQETRELMKEAANQAPPEFPEGEPPPETDEDSEQNNESDPADPGPPPPPEP